ncbi:lactonase family protein [Paraglaciecola aquimarina]|uniref:Lactonase family protein n=1 Tax=Paraglaciecola aquimarina TaxID=1235557 RepID=A0ABU3T117_9ALTE|nr:lactonase family protein [Paraglaciecola aquimarina]MDU0355948.1 lactonase family protein [Paraglaciecola aquimarina]
MKLKAILCGLSMLAAQATFAAQQEFLIGTYTQDGSEGVYRIVLDDTKQELKNIGLVASAVNPSYLSIDSQTKNILAATGKQQGGIASFKWNNNTAKFDLVQQVEGLGRGACHIATNPDGSKVAIADYGSGEVFMYSVDTQSLTLSKAGYFKNEGKGDNSRQEAPHMHYVEWDKTGRFLYAVDLGTDEIKLFDSQDSEFTAQVAAKLQAGDGPRHIAQHPQKAWVFGLNELSNTITVFDQDLDSGKLNAKQRVELLRDTDPDGNTASAIKVSADGRYVYAAVRGVNKISVLSVGKNGKLKLLQQHSTIGNWPRDITISADQNYLLIANQKSGDISVLARNNETGLLSATSMQLPISTPSYIGNF